MENPCPKMEELGYIYNYNEGLVDETPYYKKASEDTILYTGHDYNIQFNLESKTMVMVMHNDNADCYGDKPTFFLSKDLLSCVEEIVQKLGWKE